MANEKGVFLVGINHIDSPLSCRERAAVAKDEILPILGYLKSYARLDEIVLLSTCSRVEIIGAANDPLKSSELIHDWLLRRVGEESRSCIYVKQGNEAILHLFRVASGLDSWILGESEILAQFKEAYHFALEQGLTGPTLNRIFQKAIAAGKAARSQTGLQNGISSIGGAAAALANRILGTRRKGPILVFGAGQAAQAVTRHLVAKEFSQVLVANRHFDRARMLAEPLGAQAVTLEEGLRRLAEAEAAIFSLTCFEPLVTADSLKKRLGPRPKPLFLIDLGLPRNVEPECAQIEGVYLYNLDDLKNLVNKSMEKRLAQKQKAERITKDLALQCGCEMSKLVTREMAAL